MRTYPRSIFMIVAVLSPLALIFLLLTGVDTAHGQATKDTQTVEAKITFVSPPSISAPSTVSVNEGADLTVTVTLDKDAPAEFTVTPTYTEGTAKSGADYTPNTADIAFTGGKAGAKSFTVSTIGDDTKEDDKTFTINLVANHPRVGKKPSIKVVVTIIDDDPDPTVPGAPTLTATASGQTTINLSWTAPTNTGSAPISGYQIEMSNDGTSGWSNLVANTFSTTTTYSHTGLSAGTTRYYRVSAINSEGTGAVSNIASATTSTPTTTVPGAPTLTATASGQTTINLSWTAPTNTGSAPISGYQIEMSNDGTSGWSNLVANTFSTTTTYSHTGLSAGTTRYYRVSAINSEGTGAVSNIASATTSTPTTTVPGAPTLTATASGQTTINLSWTAPTNTGSAPISGYQIEMSNDGTSGWSNLVANTFSTTTTYSHTGLSAGTTRYYRVSAINTAGTGAASNVDSATTDTDDDGTTITRPDAPTLTATASGQTTINLSWTKPADNGSEITGYYLESKQDGGNFTNLATPSSSDLAYTHSGLNPGTRYCYRIDAKNSIGRGAWSSEACATTDSAPAVTPTLAIRNAQASEGDNLNFTIALDRAVSGGFTVRPTYTDGRAISGTHYTPNTTPISFTGTAGETQSFAVATIENSTSDGNRAFTVGLSASLSSIDDSDTATGTIVDDDTAVNITASTSSLSMPTNATRTFTVSLAGNPSQSVTARATLSIPPLSGTTITPTSGLTLQRGSLSGTFTVRSGSTPGTSTITVSGSPTASVSGSPTISLTVYARPTIAVNPQRLILYKPTTSGTFKVRLTEPPRKDETLTLSAPSAVTVSPKSLLFTPSTWMTEQEVRVNVATSAPIQGYTVTIAPSTSGDIPSDRTVTVDVKQRPVLTISPDKVTVSQGESMDVTLTLTPPNTDEAVTVSASIPSSATGVSVTPKLITIPRQTGGASVSRKTKVSASLIAALADAGSEHEITFSGSGNNGVNNTASLKVQVNYTKPQLCIGSQSGGTCSKTQSFTRAQNGFPVRVSLTTNKLIGSGPTTTLRQSKGSGTGTLSSWFCTPGGTSCTGTWKSDGKGGGEFSVNIGPYSNSVPTGDYEVTAVAVFSATERDSVKIPIKVTGTTLIGWNPRFLQRQFAPGQKGTFNFGTNLPPTQAFTATLTRTDTFGGSAPTLTPSTFSFTQSNYSGFKLNIAVGEDVPARSGPYTYEITAPPNQGSEKIFPPSALSISIRVTAPTLLSRAEIIIVSGLDEGELILEAGQTKDIMVRLSHNPLQGFNPPNTRVTFSGLTADYFSGPTPAGLTYTRQKGTTYDGKPGDYQKQTGEAYIKKVSIGTDLSTAKTADHTLVLTANGGGYANVTKIIKVKTKARPCSAGFEGTPAALAFGNWRKPDAGKAEEIVINPVDGSVDKGNLIPTGDGAPSVGRATITAGYCNQCMVKVARPDMLKIKGTQNTVPYAGIWAHSVTGTSFTAETDEMKSFDPLGAVEDWRATLQFGGKAEITNATTVGDYTGQIELSLTCE